MQTSFASPPGFGGALTDPPWSLSGETARMKKTVLPGSALLGGKVVEKGEFKKRCAEQYALIFRKDTTLQGSKII